MKKVATIILIALSIPFVLVGCKSGKVNDMASSLKSEVGSVIDKTESAIEHAGNNQSKISGTYSPKISKAEAKDIAIKHSGVKTSDIRDMDIDLEYDNGTANYEIDFEAGSMEYDYHIDAETGEVLFFTKDKND